MWREREINGGADNGQKWRNGITGRRKQKSRVVVEAVKVVTAAVYGGGIGIFCAFFRFPSFNVIKENNEKYSLLRWDFLFSFF